jgi:hypothetical protein
MIKVSDQVSKRMDVLDLVDLMVEMEDMVGLSPLMTQSKRLAKTNLLSLNLTILVKRPNMKDLVELVETIRKLRVVKVVV